MKDIFIDATIASKFVSTKDPILIELRDWLEINNGDANDPYLVVSDYLRKEYFDVNKNCSKQYSICYIYSEMQKTGRINPISKKDISDFHANHFTQKIWSKLSCKTNKRGKKSNDPEHIAAVFLSKRRMAIIEDQNFSNDLISFPMQGIKGKAPIVKNCPSKLNYK